MMDPMQGLGYSIDAWLGELATLGRSQETLRSYGRIVNAFADTLPADWLVSDITPDECRRFLAKSRHLSRSTNAQHVTVLRRYFFFLWRNEKIKANPMDRIDRPRRTKPEDLDVVSVSTGEVRRMMEAASAMGWPEKMCMALLCYLGPRRSAAASLRRRDVDLERGTVKFREKGDKFITKPLPDNFRAVVELAAAEGVWEGPRDWLIPNYPKGPRASAVKRSNRIVYDIVKNIAAKAGVDAHPHALRAAFAVYYLEEGGDLKSLQHLLGHERPDTTEHYLRRFNKYRAMEQVRGLDWGVSFTSVSLHDTPRLDPAFAEFAPKQGHSGGSGASLTVGFDLTRALRRVLAGAAV